MNLLGARENPAGGASEAVKQVSDPTLTGGAPILEPGRSACISVNCTTKPAHGPSLTVGALIAFLLCACSAWSQAEWRQSPGYAAYQKGNVLFIARKFPESAAALEEALRLDPKLVPALTLQANLAMAGEHFDMARQSLERALAVDPNSANAEFLYGMVAYMANDLREALQRFEKARQFGPSDPRAAFYLGLTAETLGQTDRALTEYQQAVRLEQRAGAPQAATFLAGARLLLLMGRAEEAERWVVQALQVEPRSRDGHFEFARLLLKRAAAAQAAREGEAALLLHGGDVTDAQIHYLLIRAYRESRSTEKAERHAEILRSLEGKQGP